jgi:mercuric ion transport protein
MPSNNYSTNFVTHYTRYLVDKARASEIMLNSKPLAGSGKTGRTNLTQVTAIGSLLAALAASSCCVIPFLLFSLGISGAWISHLTALSAYQPYFASGSLLLLAVGIALIRRRRRSCAMDGYCATSLADRMATWGLWTAGVVIATVLAFPYLMSLLGAV